MNPKHQYDPKQEERNNVAEIFAELIEERGLEGEQANFTIQRAMKLLQKRGLVDSTWLLQMLSGCDVERALRQTKQGLEARKRLHRAHRAVNVFHNNTKLHLVLNEVEFAAVRDALQNAQFVTLMGAWSKVHIIRIASDITNQIQTFCGRGIAPVAMNLCYTNTGAEMKEAIEKRADYCSITKPVLCDVCRRATNTVKL